MKTFLKSCVASPLNFALTLGLVAAAAAGLPPFARWALFDAAWRGTAPQSCAQVRAACWPFVRAHGELILFGRFPAAEHWRVELAAAAGLAAILVLLLPRLRHKLTLAALFLILYPPAAALLLRGGVLGLAPVPTTLWGGLMLTATVAAWTIASAIPLGLLLALGRRSRLPVVAWLAAGYIDIVRGLPLVGVLFLAVVLLPLFMPPGLAVNNLVSAMAAFTLFNAATLAEVFRGGLQSVPSYHREGGAALGLSHRQTLLLVVLPQAIAAALPGLVNVAVEIVKETTLILIVGLLDLLGVLQGAIVDPAWLVGDQVRTTAYFLAGLVFWTLCFGLSRYSARLERGMSAHRRV